MRPLQITITILACLIICNLSVAQKKKKGPAGFVYGNIHGIEGIRHIYIQKLGKVYIGNFNRPKTEVLEDGTCYFEKVEPGEYYLAGFSIRGGDMFWIPYTKESVKDALFTVSPESIQYMGSYVVSNLSKGGLKQGSFEIDPAQNPSEKEVLQVIRKQMSEGPWIKLLSAKLQQL